MHGSEDWRLRLQSEIEAAGTTPASLLSLEEEAGSRWVRRGVSRPEAGRGGGSSVCTGTFEDKSPTPAGPGTGSLLTNGHLVALCGRSRAGGPQGLAERGLGWGDCGCVGLRLGLGQAEAQVGSAWSCRLVQTRAGLDLAVLGVRWSWRRGDQRSSGGEAPGGWGGWGGWLGNGLGWGLSLLRGVGRTELRVPSFHPPRPTPPTAPAQRVIPRVTTHGSPQQVPH